MIPDLSASIYVRGLAGAETRRPGQAGIWFYTSQRITVSGELLK